MLFQSSQAQLLGKWIIPTKSDISSNITYELEFTGNTILNNSLGVPLIDIPSEFSAGGYNNNYDFNFFSIGNIIGDGGSITPWIASYKVLNPDYQIIMKPGSSNEYYSFFSHYQTIDGYWMSYNTITFNEVTGTPAISPEITLAEFDDGYAAFAISEEQNNERNLYTTCKLTDANTPAGLYRYTIESSGITNKTEIISEAGVLSNYDFDAYNLELNLHNNQETILAWINGVEDTYQNRTVDRIIIVKNSSVNVYDLNYGRIGGIEFSSFEENVLYASCTDVGIVKVDYTNFNNPSITTIPNSSNYAHTFLQAAPDGNIYGVSDDGSNLGKIDMQSGIFTPNYHDFPNNAKVSTYHEFWNGASNSKYYILPENERVHCPFSVNIETEDTECPEDPFGRVEIQVNCGLPPYQITSNPVIEFEWNDNLQAFVVEGLTAGTYSFVVTDNGQNSIEESFEIRATYDFYDFLTIFGDYEFPNTTYPETNYTFEKGIHIFADPANGNTPVVTINESTFEFGPDAKIIIEPGATLIVNGSSLKNLQCIPFDTWQGVEVWGNSSQSQIAIPGEECFQGKLILKNESTIEHAKIAVDLWEPNNYSSTGGIVIAENSSFINNARAVRALNYSNFDPNSPIGVTVWDNESYFNNCVFDINTNYIGSETFYKHIDLSNVKGFSFKGCDFTNTATNNISAYNCGIMAMDAGFSVEQYCNYQPCTTGDESNLSGFYSAVWAANERTTNTFLVSNANFTNNAIGIKVNAVNNAAIISSNFNIGYNNNPFSKEECLDRAISYGIVMLGSTGFAIEENYFTTTESLLTGDYVGIYISETQATDEVYNNDFENLSYGNYAVGKNWKLTNVWEGLAYFCNTNSGVKEDDFSVQKNAEQVGGVQSEIGSTALGAGNTFSSIANFNFNNRGNHEVGYFYYDNNGTPGNKYPEIVYHVTREPVSIQNQCLPHYGGGGGTEERNLVLTTEQEIEAEEEYSAAIIDYTNIRTLYDNLVDGGNTTGELLDIATAQPGDMWELRAQLLGKSPHLSMEVLKAAADKTEVLPESAIFDVMAANPDELKKNELISYLEEKENPLPVYMVNILRQVATGSTYKTVLHRKMAHSNRTKTRAAHDIIRSILNDTVVDYNQLRNWLDNMGGVRADEQIIASFTHEENYIDALALAAMMPELYGYNEQEMVEHNYYTEMLNLHAILAQEGRKILELNTVEINALVNIAENSKGKAGLQAQGILEYAYGYEFCNCINTDTTVLKSSAGINSDTYQKLLGLTVDVKPNPASEWATFNYNLPNDNAEGTIEINDVTGKLIEVLQISGNKGQKLWNTRKVKPGLYMYTLSVNGISKTGKLVISK